ncbi:hypothetical protein [Novosphingobium mangrovi (ex Huang et al. 2023)]|uniref:Sulfotransferase family protein n=1 Tax=Novosphingobium mangrovi (ex Huang et al. 2023) TaxID=2976432 RepID=A0ABT2I125_9SPHN|nr:hypothetical protein [Novosphingobium mangrovi (ex Huang et al. 2023)]MCT2398512.1 hypothetical protein [Novosphingobium mangrovi (ex Huang et al. 2023)]
MILVPEISTVVILTPRTGTRALKRAIAQRYPEATLLYRHMEADGVPFGYDRWRKVGVCRNPVERLWSLYKYLDRFGLDWCAEHDETYTARMRDSVQVPFEWWLMHNDLPFTTPYDSAGLGRFFPAYACRHPLPENRKSQFMYLRPDLGTEIYPYSQIGRLFAELDVDPPRLNGTSAVNAPTLSSEAQEYVSRWFAWDLHYG